MAILKKFVASWEPQRPTGFFSRNRKKAEMKPGVYLDGGFGVGKTHLLASLWHERPLPKYFGTFMNTPLSSARSATRAPSISSADPLSSASTSSSWTTRATR